MSDPFTCEDKPVLLHAQKRSRQTCIITCPETIRDFQLSHWYGMLFGIMTCDGKKRMRTVLLLTEKEKPWSQVGRCRKNSIHLLAHRSGINENYCFSGASIDPQSRTDYFLLIPSNTLSLWGDGWTMYTVHTASVSNQNSRTFQGQFVIFQGLKITEFQDSAILTHIFLLYKAHVTDQGTVTCSTETALGRSPHIILRFKNKAALRWNC